MTHWKGRLLQWLGLPGLVRSVQYEVWEGETLEVKTSPWFTVLRFGDREFYFRRDTGAFDGVGLLTDDPTAINRLRAERTRRLRSSRGPNASAH